MQQKNNVKLISSIVLLLAFFLPWVEINIWEFSIDSNACMIPKHLFKYAKYSDDLYPVALISLLFYSIPILCIIRIFKALTNQPYKPAISEFGASIIMSIFFIISLLAILNKMHQEEKIVRFIGFGFYINIIATIIGVLSVNESPQAYPSTYNIESNNNIFETEIKNTTNNTDIIKQLSQLFELKEKGVLTEEIYNAEKQNLLNKLESSKKIETIKTIHVNGYNFDMIYVKGETFTMGCTDEQGSDCGSDEKPAHQVTLSDYYIGKYEVTQGLWKKVMGSNPSEFKNCRDDCPVENVSWNDCQEFINMLNQLTGKRFRLPTEAEWEYAARGGNKASYQTKYAGSNVLDEVAWYNGNSKSHTHTVGTKKPNALGIYDMSGNVWEWCNDWYGDYSSGGVTNPKGAATGSYRVIRGGSWYYDGINFRVSLRNGNFPSLRYSEYGLRLAFSS